LEGFFFFKEDLVRVRFLDLLGETEEIGSMAILSSETGMSVLNFVLMWSCWWC